jgi:hypothetical protein
MPRLPSTPPLTTPAPSASPLARPSTQANSQKPTAGPPNHAANAAAIAASASASMPAPPSSRRGPPPLDPLPVEAPPIDPITGPASQRAMRAQIRAADVIARPPTPLASYKANLPPMRPPMPSDEGFMTQGEKLSLAEFAFVLRDEQVQAKIALYRADLQTNPELDAITAQVVAELRALQEKVGREGSVPPPSNVKDLEAELTHAFTTHLERLFRQGKLAAVFERKLAVASKRFARLFFESELHEKIRGSQGELKTMRFAEQALFRVLTRFDQHLLLELESFEYESTEVLDRAKELFDGIVRELRNKYLGRTTPELNALVSHLNEVLNAFLTEELPPHVGEIATRVVREARLAHSKMTVSYKVSADGFVKLRAAYERAFLTLLVPYVEEEMLKRVRARDARFRVETIRFVADPHIFSDVCELICEATYDSLYNEGFLDLPADWRARLTDEG